MGCPWNDPPLLGPNAESEMSILYLASPRARARAVQSLIHSAQRNIIVQMYLFAGSGELRTLRPVLSFPWAATVADWLIARKRMCPDLDITVILDTQTIEDASLTHRSAPLTRHRLESAGIAVYHASLARTAFNRKRRFFARARFHEFWEQPKGRLSKSEWARRQNQWQILHNVEDHRKNLVIDNGKLGIVFSHNFIDQAYTWQENTIWLRGAPALQLWNIAEQARRDAIALPVELSATQAREISRAEVITAAAAHEIADTRILDGGPEIQKAILAELSRTSENQTQDIRAASAYFSDPVTLSALSLAGKNARVRVLIDNCHALSLPWLLHFFLRNTVNLLCVHGCRQTTSVELRIFESTHTEMMHLKAVAFSGRAPCLIAGQANFTPNSFSGAWLETSVHTKAPHLIRQFERHFDTLWARAKPVQRYAEMKTPVLLWNRLHAGFFLWILRWMGRMGFRY